MLKDAEAACSDSHEVEPLPLRLRSVDERSIISHS